METARRVLAAVLLGLLIRGWRGYSMLDPFYFIPCACLSAVLAGPAILQLGGDKKATPILAQIARAVLQACGSVGIMLAAALCALNFPWYETWLLPGWFTVLGAGLLSVASATGAAALTGLLLVRLPARVVVWLWRGLFFTGLLAWRFAPGNWGNSTVIAVLDWGVSTTALGIASALTVADAGLIYLLVRRAGYNKATA